MDHSSAHLIEFTNSLLATETVERKISKAREEDLGKIENLVSHKDRHQQSAYYKQLGSVIKNYENVVLFGRPTPKRSCSLYCAQTNALRR